MAKTLSEDDRKFLTEAFGEDAVKTLESQTEQGEKILEGLLAFKALTQGTSDETPTEEPPADEKAKKPNMPMDDMTDEQDDEEEDQPKKKEAELAPETDEIVKQVLGVLNVAELQKVLAGYAQTLQDAVKEIEDLKAEIKELRKVASDVKELKKTDDEKIAAALQPINWKGVGYSASQDKQNEVGDQKGQLMKAAPVGSANPNDFLAAITAPLQRGA